MVSINETDSSINVTEHGEGRKGGLDGQVDGRYPGRLVSNCSGRLCKSKKSARSSASLHPSALKSGASLRQLVNTAALRSSMFGGECIKNLPSFLQMATLPLGFLWDWI